MGQARAGAGGRTPKVASGDVEVLEYEEHFEETLLLGDHAVEWGVISGSERSRATGRKTNGATGRPGRGGRGWWRSFRPGQLDQERAPRRQRERWLGQHQVELERRRVEEQRDGDAEPGRMALP